MSGRPVALVACSAAKLTEPAPAKDLYQGQLFRLARAWAERFAARWYVLSALHGVLDPSRVIEPYDLSMADRARGLHWRARTDSPIGRREGKPVYGMDPIDAWATTCRGQLMGGAAGPTVYFEGGDTLVMLAGAAYREPLTKWLPPWGARQIETPLTGLGIGRQKQWLRRELDRWADRNPLLAGAALPAGCGGSR